MVEYPDDFSFKYSWQMGSVPPPYYYEYTIEVFADGTGSVELIPDYPLNLPGKRTAPLNLDQNLMEYLYKEMKDAGVFEIKCQVVDSNWIGGSQSSLDVHAFDSDYQVPYSISIADSKRLEPVFLAIQELLPTKLLSGLPG